jgi:hypothetical protein
MRQMRHWFYVDNLGMVPDCADGMATRPHGERQQELPTVMVRHETSCYSRRASHTDTAHKQNAPGLNSH